MLTISGNLVTLWIVIGSIIHIYVKNPAYVLSLTAASGFLGLLYMYFDGYGAFLNNFHAYVLVMLSASLASAYLRKHKNTKLT